MLEYFLNAITRLPMDRLGRNLGGPSYHVPDMSAMMRLSWQRPLLRNGALNILHLWASGGRTREPILMKFGTQQQVRTAITVMRSNIKISKIQNSGRPPCWKYIRNAITRLPIDRLGRNLGGHIPSCPWHVPHVAVAMATAVAKMANGRHVGNIFEMP